MPSLPMFSLSNGIKENSQSQVPTVPISFDPSNSSNFNTILPFFFFPFTQNSNSNNNNNNNSSSPLHVPISIPSLEEFFAKLDGEFMQFKNIFEEERITVDQIYDLTDVEFSQLGINKIGWRKAFRAAAQCYKK